MVAVRCYLAIKVLETQFGLVLKGRDTALKSYRFAPPCAIFCFTSLPSHRNRKHSTEK